VNLRRPDQGTYDFVCADETTGNEIAIEVKQLTDEGLESSHRELNKVLREVEQDIGNHMPGTFSLCVTMGETRLPLRGNSDRNRFKYILEGAILVGAMTLRSGESVALHYALWQYLGVSSPEDLTCDLKKLNDSGAALYVHTPGYGGSGPSIPVDDDTLEIVTALVRRASTQLAEARAEPKPRETFLLLVEESFSGVEADVLEEAIKHVDSCDYSSIDKIYRMSGHELKRINLPSQRGEQA